MGIGDTAYQWRARRKGRGEAQKLRLLLQEESLAAEASRETTLVNKVS